MLKLKTYCWNHCSKIIFKCVNSTVGPIFNEKVTKKWNLWVHEQYIIHCLRQKSQHLLLLFIEQYMNNNRVLSKRVKKKRKKRKTQTVGGKRESKKSFLFSWCCTSIKCFGSKSSKKYTWVECFNGLKVLLIILLLLLRPNEK